jgi:hypothetical protein
MRWLKGVIYIGAVVTTLWFVWHLISTGPPWFNQP